MPSHCPTCGKPLLSETCERCANQVVFHIVQREIVLLIVLSLALIPLFIFTRAMAARNRAMNIDVARTWYRLGEGQLNAGNKTEAIESFRAAATNDHNNAQYMLVLARALADTNHVDEARQILMRLRTSQPESGEFNLALARLSAKDEQAADAVRYYHNALFGVWTPDQVAAQRTTVRTELVRFLLRNGDIGPAIAELLILSSDVPDTEEAYNQLGRLFLEAGDSQRALAQFNRTLKLNPKNVDALSGGGQALFELADYLGARRYLQRALAGGNPPDVKELLDTTERVLSRDPLASGIRTDERIRRLMGDLEFAAEDLQACIQDKQGDQESLAVLNPLWIEMEGYKETEFRPQELRRDPEGFSTGLSVIQRVESATGQICGRSSPIAKALLLIARKHGIGEQ